MRGFLLSICPFVLWISFILNTVFCILLMRGYFKNEKHPLWLLCALVSAGLVYDALILSLGTILNAGSGLAAVSQFRFISHGALIPLIFPICAHALKVPKSAKIVVWVATGILIGLGMAEGIVTDLELREIAGVVRYAASADTPKWAETVSSVLSFGTVIPLMIAGIVVWIREKTPFLFLSGFLMFLFSAIGPATGNSDLIFFISMIGEVLMVLFFFLFARRRERRSL